MNEKTLQLHKIIEDCVKREFEECAESAAEPVFSKRHKRAMKRIFKLFEKNKRKMKSRHRSFANQTIKEGA